MSKSKKYKIDDELITPLDVNYDYDVKNKSKRPKIQNLVTISCIGDGSCFFHTLLKATNREYQEDNNLNNRINLAKNFRKEVATLINQKDPDSLLTKYETIGGGVYYDLIDDPTLGINAITKLLNSKNDVGEEIYSIISNLLGINLLFLTFFTGPKETDGDAVFFYTCTPSIDIPATKTIVYAFIPIDDDEPSHYELIGLKTENGIQTIFDKNNTSDRDIISKLLTLPKYGQTYNISTYDDVCLPLID